MELTCIVCPMGCRISAETVDGELVVKGNTCKRGEVYAKQEATCPMRTLTTLVKLNGGEESLCPVKTNAVIPKELINEALKAVKSASVSAPVKIGDVIISNVVGTGVDIVATANRVKGA